MTTNTTFARLSKPDAYQVGWADLINANLDTIDQGISVFKLTNAHGGTVPAYGAVKFGTSAGQFVGAVLTTTGIPCDGIALADSINGEVVSILSRGFVENSGWAFTIGDIIYLTSTTLATGVGSFLTRASLAYAIEGAVDSTLLMQPVGIAVSPTRVYFDFNRFRQLSPYVIPASKYFQTSGTAVTESIKSIAGPGFAHVITSGGAADIVYSFILPPWFRAMPDIAGVWGFRINYKLTSGSIDVTQVYDGNNHNADPGVANGSSTSWTNFDVDWDKFNDVSGWAPAVGKQVMVKVNVSATGADLEVAPFLRFEPIPTIFA